MLAGEEHHRQGAHGQCDRRSEGVVIGAPATLPAQEARRVRDVWHVHGEGHTGGRLTCSISPSAQGRAAATAFLCRSRLSTANKLATLFLNTFCSRKLRATLKELDSTDPALKSKGGGGVMAGVLDERQAVPMNNPPSIDRAF